MNRPTKENAGITFPMGLRLPALQFGQHVICYRCKVRTRKGKRPPGKVWDGSGSLAKLIDCPVCGGSEFLRQVNGRYERIGTE